MVKNSVINTLEYAVKMTEELDKILVADSVFGMCVDNNLRAKFVGAKTVMIPSIDMQALADYDRDTGFVRGSVSVGRIPYTLSMDRGRSFQVDREDDDETGVADLQGNVLREFVRTKVNPELDAYCASKLAGLAVLRGNVITGTPATGAVAMLNQAITAVQDVAGYGEELVAFVSNTFWSALNATPEITRQINVGEFKRGEVTTKVKMLDGVALIPVPSPRMKTAYTFLDGETAGQKDGGFIPAENAKDIGFIVMPRKAAKLVKKTEKIRNFSPDQNLDADAWKTDYRVYYDMFVMESMANTVFTFIYEGGNSASLGEATGANAELYGKTLADLQSGVTIDNQNGIITGRLKEITNYGGGSGFDAADGTHFIALQINNLPDGYTPNIKVTGGKMTAGVTPIAGEDYSFVIQLADAKKQGLTVTLTKASSPTYTKHYRFDHLIFQ